MLLTWILMIVFVSLYLFYEISYKNALRRKNKREKINYRRKQFSKEKTASQKCIFRDAVSPSENDATQH